MSIRGRIVAGGAVVVVLALLGFATVLVGDTVRRATAARDTTLSQLAATTAGRVASLGTSPPPPPLAPPLDLRSDSGTYVELLDAGGAVVQSTAEVDGTAPAIGGDVLAAARAHGLALATLAPASGVSVRVAVRPLPGGGWVAAGQSATALQALLRGEVVVVVLSGVVALVAAVTAIWITAGRALRPLDRIAATADRIAWTADPRERLPALPAQDQLSRLTSSFNAMLARLQASQQGLAAALEAQQRFVADASHELRTPLTTLRGNAGFLAAHPDADPADRDAAVRDILEESERMTRLVEDLLALARADAGRPLALTPLDVSAIAREVAERCARRDAARTVTCTGDAAVFALADGDAIRRLLWILLDNAVRHTGDGGTVEVRCRRSGAAVRLEVADNGDGIAPADLERIFGRFSQASPARAGGAAGLGLAIARGIAGAHGGRIFAQSPGPGRGSVFTVELWAAEPSSTSHDRFTAGSPDAPSIAG